MYVYAHDAHYCRNCHFFKQADVLYAVCVIVVVIIIIIIFNVA